MKITMYELLGKIKDGKAPKKIIYRNNLFEYIGGVDDYEPDDIKKYHGNFLLHYLFEEEVGFLDDEVEILEEKKIPEKIIPTSLKGIDNLNEKIDVAHIDTISVIETVNQLIDYLKSKGDE